VGVLISKPGLTSATTLAIPTNWSASWFRSLIASYLTGADVRNAVGSGGIVVSGNITSPYATIGFAPPVSVPAPFYVTYNDSTLFEVMQNGQAGFGGPASGYVVSPTYWFQNAGTVNVGIRDTTDSTEMLLYVYSGGAIIGSSSDSPLYIRTNNTNAIVISAAGAVTIEAPSSGNPLTVNGLASAYTGVFNASTTTGASLGVAISAGTNSSDEALLVRNAAASSNYFVVRGDGAIAFHGASPTAQSTGWGTPTGASVVSNLVCGASASLTTTSEALGALIIYLKSIGLLGA
jgi:hypothetical protein